MTNEQSEAFDALSTVQERAKFLLNIGVSAKLDIDPDTFEPVYRACVDGIFLPIDGCSEKSAILKAKAWLETKAELPSSIQL